MDLPAAALLTAAVAAIERSRGFRGRGWSIATGVLAGLMLLAKTMSGPFLLAPALLALRGAWREGGGGRAGAGPHRPRGEPRRRRRRLGLVGSAPRSGGPLPLVLRLGRGRPAVRSGREPVERTQPGVLLRRARQRRPLLAAPRPGRGAARRRARAPFAGPHRGRGPVGVARRGASAAGTVAGTW